MFYGYITRVHSKNGATHFTLVSSNHRYRHTLRGTFAEAKALLQAMIAAERKPDFDNRTHWEVLPPRLSAAQAKELSHAA